MLSSDTIKDVIAAIGGGIGKSFDIDKVRYDKINIMCDADVDFFGPISKRLLKENKVN